MRYIRLANVCLVGGVKNNQRIVGQCIVHPLLQLFMGQSGSGGIIGITEIDQIHAMVRNIGYKIVLCRTRQIGHIVPFPVFVQHPRTPAHDIAVDIHRIHRIGNGHTVVPAQQFSDVARIAFGSIADKYFGGREADATRCEVVLDNGIYQKIISLLRSISPERIHTGQLVNRTVHGLNAGLRKRTGYIAYPQPDQPVFGMSHLKRIDSFCYI